MANPKQTQTQALTDWLWSKLWVDLAQLPAEEKKASAKKMGGGSSCAEKCLFSQEHTCCF